MNESDDRYENARANAMASMASIRELVARLDHAEECDGEDCDLDPADMDGMEPDEYHDSDEARYRILDDALSVEVRGGWHSPGDESEDEEFMILLTTGGSALRVIGDFDEYGDPKRPRLQMQDWGLPWQDVIMDSEDYAALETHCRVFWFGD